MGASGRLTRLIMSHRRALSRAVTRSWPPISTPIPTASTCFGLSSRTSCSIGSSELGRDVAINSAVPNIKSERPAETRDFFVELLGFEVAMDMGWVVTVASPTSASVQVTIIGNDDMAAPGISVGVADIEAVHAKAVEQGFEIVYSLRDEEWGVRRFMVREPGGTIVNVVSHRAAAKGT